MEIKELQTLKESISSATSALKISSISDDLKSYQNVMNEIDRQKCEKEKTILESARANIKQKELVEQQLELLRNQNELLSDNYNKLKELYDYQVEINMETNKELEKSRKYNLRMMIIAFVAMIAAVAGPIITILGNR